MPAVLDLSADSDSDGDDAELAQDGDFPVDDIKNLSYMIDNRYLYVAVLNIFHTKCMRIPLTSSLLISYLVVYNFIFSEQILANGSRILQDF